MASIHIDDKTAQQLESHAAALGLTPDAYVAALLAKELPESGSLISPEEFDKELDALSIDGPTLPVGFSRADIYADHD